jgi:outer membrane protein assembly factor BamE (lipoprotein component of BamABCDE complex)
MNPFKPIALPLVALVFLTGCLVSHSSNEKVTGNFIPQNTFDRIEPGKTTAAWVQATLGEPSSKDKVDGDTEVWKYSYSEQKESSGAIFLIFGGSDKKEQQHIAYVEMKNGVVTNKWRA